MTNSFYVFCQHIWCVCQALELLLSCFEVLYQWLKRNRITCKKSDQFEPVSASDDSEDELKVRFAREVCYKVKDGTPGLKIEEAKQCSHGSGHL